MYDLWHAAATHEGKLGRLLHDIKSRFAGERRPAGHIRIQAWRVRQLILPGISRWGDVNPVTKRQKMCHSM